MEADDIKKVSANLNVLVNEKQKLAKVSSSYFVQYVLSLSSEECHMIWRLSVSMYVWKNRNNAISVILRRLLTEIEHVDYVYD